MIEVVGNWYEGFAYDLHTLSSEFVGYDEYGNPQFDTTYSEMGALLHDLKYRGNRQAINKIADLLGVPEIVGLCDLIIPAPSSIQRPSQPVDEIALELGRRVGIEVMIGALEKAGSKPLKGILNPEERMEELKKAISLNKSAEVSGRRVLLLDDLYRSGATLIVCTDSLYNQGKARQVSVLTMTKTRSNR